MSANRYVRSRCLRPKPKPEREGTFDTVFWSLSALSSPTPAPTPTPSPSASSSAPFWHLRYFLQFLSSLTRFTFLLFSLPFTPRPSTPPLLTVTRVEFGSVPFWDSGLRAGTFTFFSFF
ncbi:hypothetical protein MPTK1_5g21120 [Marchantia polymorpha subsp. ruderalis]|uniref:Uncharacterized protein n=2 Tax=Marchantia polymorpha TaxID=3197 RepID=A0AAF6BKM7_MARPO|nr:hypothetical protein MARPO_0058s0094 [Marchantia polymorpha]BBN12561.1 hypothetical protein Mp_5g21120 [Marchantia polymorpha subsp. ruderalis]|eukprot:PTQ37321.1 hypothetical protein MARPO_0058s0094 [Marchantia polymorpha]